MWTTNFWNDFDRSFSAFDDFRRRVDHVFGDLGAYIPAALDGQARTRSWPATNVYDTGKEIVVQAVLPGLSDKDIELNLTRDVLTISGERRTEAPEGYSVHRQERGSIRFSRSLTLPTRVDPEKTAAELKNGVLTVRASKAEDAQPRQISIRAS